MSNPGISNPTVTDTASLVVSEPGKYRLTYGGGTAAACYLGTSTVDPATGSTHCFVVAPGNPVDVTFDADVELYGRCATGQNVVLRIVRWF